ncbi:hypothetical protein B0A48_12757 [Cryoendolithus antarcticus]|uniref:Uncharacterized protein n=1 Tax=Cryoendolithus antarcticus TaxID=1507870 RepID=A0A1V8SRL7_9PEZI|nr:hypothetical protein B0A48_12757 [Cryoendolithus antarcticus]
MNTDVHPNLAQLYVFGEGADAFPNEFLLNLACALYKSPEERLSFDKAHVKEITEKYTALEQ